MAGAVGGADVLSGDLALAGIRVDRVQIHSSSTEHAVERIGVIIGCEHQLAIGDDPGPVECFVRQAQCACRIEMPYEQVVPPLVAPLVTLLSGERPLVAGAPNLHLRRIELVRFVGGVVLLRVVVRAVVKVVVGVGVVLGVGIRLRVVVVL